MNCHKLLLWDSVYTPAWPSYKRGKIDVIRTKIRLLKRLEDDLHALREQAASLRTLPVVLRTRHHGKAIYLSTSKTGHNFMINDRGVNLKDAADMFCIPTILRLHKLAYKQSQRLSQLRDAGKIELEHAVARIRSLIGKPSATLRECISQSLQHLSSETRRALKEEMGDPIDWLLVEDPEAAKRKLVIKISNLIP